MITIKNTQRKIALDVEALYQDAQRILCSLSYQDFDLGIWLTTNRTIREYNKNFRNKNKATDILSFPYHSDLKAGEAIIVNDEEDKNMGDLIISLEYVHNKLTHLDKSLKEQLRILLIHGICHVLGYDHITDEDYSIMNAQENYLLSLLD